MRDLFDRNHAPISSRLLARSRYLAPKAKVTRSNRVGCASFFEECLSMSRAGSNCCKSTSKVVSSTQYC